MKLLFVHGTKMKEDKKGNLYTGGSYNCETWARYQAISSKLSVIARKEKEIYEVEEAQETFNWFDIDRMDFVEIPNDVSSIISFLSITNRKRINSIIKNQVSKNDLLIVRLPCSYGEIAIRYAKKYNKPYLVEVVGCAWDSLWNYSIKGKLLAPLRYYGMKRSIAHAPYVVYVTSEFLQNRYPTEGKQEGCSDVSLPAFNDKIIDQRVDRINNKANNTKIIIGTIAAVDVKYKGQEYIIKSLAQLKEMGILNYEYHLIGDGEQSYLKSMAKQCNVVDEVKFLGSQPHDKVIQWLDSIDIYIQPSLTEGLPRALIEAMSRGLPAIGSDAGGIPELLDKECIIVNISKNIESISNVLEMFDQDYMEIQARRNFIESKKYEKCKLENRRKEFYKVFRDSLK